MLKCENEKNRASEKEFTTTTTTTNNNKKIAKNHLYEQKIACNNSRYNVYIEPFDEYFFSVYLKLNLYTNNQIQSTLSRSLLFFHSFFFSFIWSHCHIGLIIKFTIVFHTHTCRTIWYCTVCTH